MKKIIILLTIFFTSITYSQKIKLTDWTTDLNFLKTELPKKHKNLFFKISKQEFDSEIDNIINQLEKDTDAETSIKLTQLIAKIGDSHTNVSIRHIVKKHKNIPIRFRWFKDGLYISGTSKSNYEILDKKLISINEYSVETIIDSLKTLFVTENIGLIRNNTKKLLSSNVLLKYFHFSKPNDSVYNLKLSDIKGNISEYQLKEVINNRKNNISMKINAEKPFYMHGKFKNFKEKYFKNEKIYFIQYNRCISKESVLKYGNKESAYNYPSFDEFEQKVLNILKTKEIEKLIFDMRFNAGGSSYLAENLIKKIAENKEINKKGNLFVVIGNKTFSAATWNTIDFKDNTNAIIVGEKTSGKANHYGYTSNFTLPYSRIKITFSTEYYKLVKDDLNTIIPDVIIEREYEHYKNGIDPIFEWVKEYE